MKSQPRGWFGKASGIEDSAEPACKPGMVKIEWEALLGAGSSGLGSPNLLPCKMSQNLETMFSKFFSNITLTPKPSQN